MFGDTSAESSDYSDRGADTAATPFAARCTRITACLGVAGAQSALGPCRQIGDCVEKRRRGPPRRSPKRSEPPIRRRARLSTAQAAPRQRCSLQMNKHTLCQFSAGSVGRRPARGLFGPASRLVISDLLARAISAGEKRCLHKYCAARSFDIIEQERYR